MHATEVPAVLRRRRRRRARRRRRRRHRRRLYLLKLRSRRRLYSVLWVRLLSCRRWRLRSVRLPRERKKEYIEKERVH